MPDAPHTRRERADGLLLRIPPLNVRIQTPFAEVDEHMGRFYGGYPRLSPDTFIDLDIAVARSSGWRRWLRPQASFLLDGDSPFLPLPAGQAAPLLEWGLNWCFASRPMGWLTIHAAVVAQGNQALVMPGFPGAGKSTLCAALHYFDGWRLLSDELALLDPGTLALTPHPRPISLKNASISLVSDFPGAQIGPLYRDTRKGTVTHAAPLPASVAAADAPAHCRWVVFPRYVSGATPGIGEVPRAEAFTLLAEQSFNDERMGAPGFRAICAMLDRAGCYRIEYGSTADARALIREICSA